VVPLNCTPANNLRQANMAHLSIRHPATASKQSQHLGCVNWGIILGLYTESGLPWGVEWWKYWFCSFFEIWKWFEHEATNHDCPEYYIFYRDVVSFQENALFFCLALWKRTHVYIQWFWCLQWILHCIVVHITICIYTIWHIYCFFHNTLRFSINM